MDEYLQDQVSLLPSTCLHTQLCSSKLIIFMALAEGRSTVRTGKVTLHTETAIYIVESLTGVRNLRILFTMKIVSAYPFRLNLIL